MDYIADFYPEVQFGGFTNADATIAFYVRVNALVKSDSVVLDVGCGRGLGSEDPVPLRRNLRNFKGRCAKVIGIDVDPDAAENPSVDEFHLISGPVWPLPDASVDVSIIDSVLEHVPEPEVFFAELERVTRPAGMVCIRTPNAASYFGLASRLIPNRLHARVLDRVQRTRVEQDVFPTLYHCNTRRRLRKVLDRHGFDSYVCGYDSEPRYLSFSRAAYGLGVLHQKFAPQMFKIALFAFGRKRDNTRAQ